MLGFQLGFALVIYGGRCARFFVSGVLKVIQDMKTT